MLIADLFHADTCWNVLYTFPRKREVVYIRRLEENYGFLVIGC